MEGFKEILDSAVEIASNRQSELTREEVIEAVIEATGANYSIASDAVWEAMAIQAKARRAESGSSSDEPQLLNMEDSPEFIIMVAGIILCLLLALLGLVTYKLMASAFFAEATVDTQKQEITKRYKD